MNNGWTTHPLGDICDVLDSRRVPITKRDRITGPYPYYGATGILSHVDNFIFDERLVLIGEDGAKWGSGERTAFIADGKYWVNNHAHVVRPDRSKILDEWIVYYLNVSDLMPYITGLTVPKLNQEKMRGILLPVPPIAEQKRIVAILDEAFEAIDKAKQNAEKNLQNAHELFESHLQSVFTQRGDGWVETTLGKEIDLLAGFAFKSSRYTTSDNGVRLLRGDNIVQGSLRWDDVKKWPASDVAEYKRYEMRAGDVVLAMDRPWVKAGLKRAQMDQDDLPSLLVQRTARLRGNGTLDNRFLFHLISSAAFMQYILGVQTGSGVPHISGQQIKDFAFIRPPVALQKQIVAGLDGLSGQVGRLESVYCRKLAALDELKKSLLHRAFSGEL